jgi:GxxExxY protein
MDLTEKYQILINSENNLAFPQMLHEELSGQIIGAAMAVLNKLGPGLDEKLYERAFVIELRGSGHFVDQQKSFPVYYTDELIGTLVPDMIVDGQVIADPKPERFS